jgi:hypothetical protein
MPNIDNYFSAHNLVVAPASDASSNESDSGESIPFSPRWASDAPKGGRQVLNRALKDSAAVPLFLAQTFIQSLRDVGYDSTTSALCEHVDNAVGAGATEIRVLIRQTGKRGALKTDILVQDNGSGMAPNVLKVATSFGGSMVFNNRGSSKVCERALCRSDYRILGKKGGSELGPWRVATFSMPTSTALEFDPSLKTRGRDHATVRRHDQELGFGGLSAELYFEGL